MKAHFAVVLLVTAWILPAWAQGDARFCANYAQNASTIGENARRKNPQCVIPSKGLHPDYNSHFNWCMGQLPSTVQSAENNIRRLAMECTGFDMSGSGAPRPQPQPQPQPVSGGQEPFGQNIGGWRFTQEPHRTAKVFCRAIRGPDVVGRWGNGKYRISMPFTAQKGSFEGANMQIGSDNSPITARADGSRIYFEIDEYDIGQMTRAQGYGWRAWNSQGSARFDSNFGAVVARLKECVRANGGQ
jgi:hypothetical protein